MMITFIIIPSLGPMLLDIVLPLNGSRSRHFAVYAEYGIDQNKYFVEIFLYTTIMITVGITIMVSVDTMHIACTAHACSLFQVVGYVDILNDTHKIVGISFSLLLGALVSLIGVRIVYVLDQMEEMIRYTFIIMGALLQLMIACYSGQKLMDESQNIFHRAYTAEWYKFSPRLKSLLIITLYRSVIPCKLTAGNLFPLSMSFFAAVVRASVSYFTTFLSLKD
ncbi:odorant receptor 67a-like [Formica exsecta]|uniref:odorant receptor 67a-like n=1 Tax=Formica exsecta TaxID=72781 RepID=UPI001144F3DA|nr:odorant receptor 67a-like [Formica exsecta]